MKNSFPFLFFFWIPSFITAQNYFKPLGGPIDLKVQSSFKDANGVLYIKTLGTNKHQKSFDDGNTWTPVFINDSIQVSQMHFEDQSYIYAVGADTALYRADLDGNNWTLIDLPNPPSFSNRLSISPTGNLYFSSYTGLYFSEDYGDAWTLTSTVAPLLYGVEFHPNGDLYSILLSSGLNLAKSNDGGSTWEEILKVEDILFQSYKSVHISKGGIVFVKKTWGDFSIVSDYHFSTDNGNSFATLLFGKSYNAFLTTNHADDIFYSDKDKVFLSKDNGQSWTDISAGIPTSSIINHIYIDEDQYLYLSLENDVLYKSVSPSNEITYVSDSGYESDFELKIFANPTTDFLNFQYDKHQARQPVTFRLVEINGRVAQEVEEKMEEEIYSIPISDLQSGVYFLQCLEKGQLLCSEQFVVQH